MTVSIKNNAAKIYHDLLHTYDKTTVCICILLEMMIGERMFSKDLFIIQNEPFHSLYSHITVTSHNTTARHQHKSHNSTNQQHATHYTNMKLAV